MTEAGWRACSDLDLMLRFLRRKASDRKMRLFACSCCRRIWHLLPHDACRQAVETAEGYADGVREKRDLAAARDAVNATHPPVDHDNYDPTPPPPSFWASSSANGTAWKSDYGKNETYPATVARDARSAVAAQQQEAESLAQGRLLHDVFGPFPCYPKPAIDLGCMAWNEGLLPKLALAIYEDRAFDRLPILADALEEAGCSDEAILSHLRSAGPHVRGCWALDLVLGRE
jgi:hypothetical protein